MAAFSIAHTAEPVDNAAQAVSEVASRASDAAATAERIIMDVASIIIIMSAIYGLKQKVSSYTNQLPEVVDTLLKIKEFLMGQREHANDDGYLDEYKKIQEHVHRIARPADGEDGTFDIRSKWNRFKASRQANKDARRLLEDVKLQITVVTGCELRKDEQRYKEDELQGACADYINKPLTDIELLNLGHSYHCDNIHSVLMAINNFVRFVVLEARHECSG